ncbi:MAG: DUF2059 domain-containing protein [Burkholderiales bacterium]|nr:DUF2059 domain-containing protein [Burkholderiales bacterium]MDE2287471.1 DUF2059 domain-containing protein [Burkholderiales bacterium]MDE2610780.1 DUF2059 domain-containing protein [Burkholderiales bacterium]
MRFINVKKWMWLLLVVPAMAMAQQSTSIDPGERAAIKDLLNAIDADKLVQAIGEGAQEQSKQMVPAILEQALVQNKSLTEAQKRAAVPTLQKEAIPKLVGQAGKVFTTDNFKNDAIQAQYDAYAKYYTTDEIKDLTKFYKSPTGQKYIKVQDQVGQDVVGGLMRKYMPQSIQATRTLAEKEVAAVKPAK